MAGAGFTPQMAEDTVLALRLALARLDGAPEGAEFRITPGLHLVLADIALTALAQVAVLKSLLDERQAEAFAARSCHPMECAGYVRGELEALMSDVLLSQAE